MPPKKTGKAIAPGKPVKGGNPFPPSKPSKPGKGGDKC